jgi:hypothetical protein
MKREILAFLYCVNREYYSKDAHPFNKLADMHLRMAVQMAMVGRLHASAKKCSYTGSHQNHKTYAATIDLDKLEHLSHLLPIGEETDPSGHLMVRTVSCTVLKRICVSV